MADEFLNDLGDDFQDDSFLPDAVDEETAFRTSNTNAMVMDDSDIEDRLKLKSVKDVAKLVYSDDYMNTIQRVKAYEETHMEQESLSVEYIRSHPEYELMGKCNDIVAQIHTEISAVHKFLRDRYEKRFPELEQLIVHPVDFARCVNRLGNNLDIVNIDLSDILPSSNIITLSVTASTTSGTPLDQEELDVVLEAANLILSMDSDRQLISGYIERRMNLFAPNLSVLVGCQVASKLISLAGGLDNLANMPSCNINAIGAKRKGTLDGFSSADVVVHAGHIYECDLVQRCPKELRVRACKLVSGKCALVARVDCVHQSRDGEIGRKYFDECEAKIEKWLEPNPGRKEKAIVLEFRKTKRAGRKFQKIRERYAMSTLRKKANRVAFGQANEDYGSEVELGMLGSNEGSGMIRIASNYENKGFKIKPPKPQKGKGKGSRTQGTGTATSIFAIAPAQGLEVEKPSLYKDADEGYFSTIGGFTSTVAKK